MKKYIELLKRALHPSEWRSIYKENKMLVNYVIFGVVTTIVSYIAFFIPRQLLSMDLVVSNVISWVCAVTAAYITNTLWVFENRPKNFKEFSWQFITFYGSRLFTLGVETLIMWICVEAMNIENVIYEMIVKMAASVVVLILNYFFSKLIIFKKKETVNEDV